MSDLRALTDRMRTCAAYIMSRPNDAPMPTEHLLDDAADLLIEASNLLCQQTIEELGAPMQLLEPATPEISHAQGEAPTWIGPHDTLPGIQHSGTVSVHPCPQCHSCMVKKVYRDANRLMIACPSCGNAWPYQKRAA